MKRWALLAFLSAAVIGCAAFRQSDEDLVPVKMYGFGDLPDDPPDNCKFVERIEVKRLESKDPPIDKLQAAARDRDANAVAHVRKDGFSDGYLGKEYRFVAKVYDCPVPKAPASGSGAAPAASAAASAAP